AGRGGPGLHRRLVRARRLGGCPARPPAPRRHPGGRRRHGQPGRRLGHRLPAPPPPGRRPHPAPGHPPRRPPPPLAAPPPLPLAPRLDGRPLSAGHGFPARLVAPGRRGFWWVKWVTSIELDPAPWWRQPPLPLPRPAGP